MRCTVDRCCCSTVTATSCLPAEASYMVQAIAGSGEVVILPGDGHLLGRSDDAITERLDEWLPDVLAVPEIIAGPDGQMT